MSIPRRYAVLPLADSAGGGSRPDLRDCRYAVALADAGSITAAARQLGIAQPPLSRHLARLERRLGLALFARSPRGVHPTPAGHAFVRHARRALAEADAAVVAARAAVGPPTLAYAVPDYERGVRLCREVVARLAGQDPSARLIGVALAGPGHEPAVRRGEVDVGFGVAASAEDTAQTFGADLAFAPLFREEAAFALVPAEHPLAGTRLIDLTQPEQRRALNHLPLASFTRDAAPALYARVEAAFAAVELTPTRVPGEPTFGTCVQLVAGGLAWAFVIGSVAERCPAGTVARRIVGVSVPGLFGALWRRDARSPMVARFVEALRARVPGG